MFDATARILTEHAVTIPAFLFAIWIAYRALLPRRSAIRTLATYVGAAAAIPLFVALFLAELTDHRLWQRIAGALIDGESAALALVVAFVDSALAAWLRLFLLVASGLWDAIQGAVSPAVPAVTDGAFLAVLFGFEFLAGAALIYALYRSSRGGDANGWLKSVGAILLLSGAFSTLVRLEALGPSESTFASGLLAAVLGLTLGVSSSILIVRPNFDATSTAADAGGTSPGADESNPEERLRRLVDGTAERVSRLFSSREE